MSNKQKSYFKAVPVKQLFCDFLDQISMNYAISNLHIHNFYRKKNRLQKKERNIWRLFFQIFFGTNFRLQNFSSTIILFANFFGIFFAIFLSLKGDLETLKVLLPSRMSGHVSVDLLSCIDSSRSKTSRIFGHRSGFRRSTFRSHYNRRIISDRSVDHRLN